jgi:hypothetical protein
MQRDLHSPIASFPAVSLPPVSSPDSLQVAAPLWAQVKLQETYSLVDDGFIGSLLLESFASKKFGLTLILWITQSACSSEVCFLSSFLPSS